MTHEPGGEETVEQNERPAAETAAAEEPKKTVEPPREDPRIKIERFLDVDLRVAQILAAEPVENADRLLKLQVDLGTEKRQVVAGIAQAYAPEELIGKRVIIVANLKPARIRGVDSNGMLLAADLDGRPIVATFDAEVPPGTRVR